MKLTKTDIELLNFSLGIVLHGNNASDSFKYKIKHIKEVFSQLKQQHDRNNDLDGVELILIDNWKEKKSEEVNEGNITFSDGTSAHFTIEDKSGRPNLKKKKLEGSR